ncbi:MAG TPA: hypothetical protein VF880_11115, partial [Actinomycetes bacterium]
MLVDDFTISAGTLVEAAESLVARGARSVMAAVTHGVFAEGSTQRLDASPIRRLIVTDTVETYRAVRQGPGGVGGAAVRRGDPAHPPPREHQRAVRGLRGGLGVSGSGGRRRSPRSAAAGGGPACRRAGSPA